MAKPLVTVADQAFFAASIEKELTGKPNLVYSRYVGQYVGKRS